MFKEYRIYKPNKTNNGAASKLQMREDKKDAYKEVLVFWESALQTGNDGKNDTFGWKDNTKKIAVKFGLADIGEFLAVLTGIKKEVGTGKGLYHQNANGNTSISFSRAEKDGVHSGYYFRVASKKGDAKLLEIKHSISLGEGAVLRVLFERAVATIHGW